jgi:hypothetical protein
MGYETYQLEITESVMIFEFISEGPKGAIKKRIHYQKTSIEDTYNLAFGDVDVETNDFDDKVVTNNNDAEKVLATVAKSVYAFIEEYPNARIYAKGSTSTRTRLYRIGISNNLEEINEQFDVYGLLDGVGWSRFKKNNNYSAFAMKLKNK